MGLRSSLYVCVNGRRFFYDNIFVDMIHLLLYIGQKADDTIFVCKISYHVSSKLYHIEISKAREQTVYIYLGDKAAHDYQNADDKMFVCKFSKNVKSKLCHIENSKTGKQTV